MSGVLQQLGVWERFHAGPHFPCPGYLWSWGNDSLAYHSFTTDARDPGRHIDRGHLKNSLAQLALALGVNIVEVERSPNLSSIDSLTP